MAVKTFYYIENKFVIVKPFFKPIFLLFVVNNDKYNSDCKTTASRPQHSIASIEFLFFMLQDARNPSRETMEYAIKRVVFVPETDVLPVRLEADHWGVTNFSEATHISAASVHGFNRSRASLEEASAIDIDVPLDFLPWDPKDAQVITGCDAIVDRH